MRRVRFVFAALLVCAMAVVATACSPAAEPEPGPEPKVAPPVIGEAGVLRVGVDLGYPPYAGTDKGREAGIDIDIAAALATELGLALELVEVGAADAPAALQSGQIDIAMGVPFTEAAVLDASFAGWYVASGPALFSSVETSVTPEQLGRVRVAVQQDSESFWDLAHTYGADALVVTETLREAFELLAADEVDAVAGDALVGAYLARDFETVAFSSQLAPATPIGITVATDAAELEAVIREALDTLASAGILDTVRAKWVDDLPVLETATIAEE